jgi:prepilin-type N-terminal cleavage/methylation domain-containing protein
MEQARALRGRIFQVRGGSMLSRSRTRSRGGYTLLEMLIVVAVISILSMIAIPSFRTYMYRSQTSEAIGFLGEIRQRQESYRAEFGQYCAVSGTGSIDGAEWAPAGALPIGGARAPWGTPANWDQLGAAPDGQVRFQFRTTAGLPRTNPGIAGYNGVDFWYVAQSHGDLDGDGDEVFFETYYDSTHVFIGDEALNTLPAGWE